MLWLGLGNVPLSCFDVGKIALKVLCFRKNLYVWSVKTKQLMKVLDAHFGRIMQLEALTIGRYKS